MCGASDQVIDSFLTQNREWATEINQRDPDFLPNLAEKQEPKVLWIGCADSRVPESVITASLPGAIFVHRNIANQFSEGDPNAASAVQFAVQNIHVSHVFVVGHTRCGGVDAALRAAGTRTRRNAVLGEWLANLTQLARDLGLEYPQGRAELTVANVKSAMSQVKEFIVGLRVGPDEDLARYLPVPKSVTIVGMVYDLETGILGEVGQRIEVGALRRKVTAGMEECSEEISDTEDAC